MGFTQKLLEEHAPLWQRATHHPFLEETAALTIPDRVFAQWLAQDYLFGVDYTRFLALLSARAPGEFMESLGRSVGVMLNELALFRKMAKRAGVDLASAKPLPTCRAYTDYLLRLAYRESFPVCFTSLWTLERAYYEAWRWVKENLRGESPWQEFIDNWTTPEFASFVEWLGESLDRIAEGQDPAELAEMEENFILTCHYEERFWQMSYSGESWD